VPDVVAPHVRSRMMAGIRGRDTKPELLLRTGLHKAGFRYRLHAKGLPGKPDLVFPRYRAVIFAHGCFWHGHDCALFKWPSTRQDFWRAKITGNVTRDETVKERLLAAGWRVLTVWECALKGPGRLAPGEVITRSAAWLRSDRRVDEIRGLK
jgi:DNA mismatch endonuclease (patch repair protein)